MESRSITLTNYDHRVFRAYDFTQQRCDQRRVQSQVLFGVMRHFMLVTDLNATPIAPGLAPGRDHILQFDPKARSDYG